MSPAGLERCRESGRRAGKLHALKLELGLISGRPHKPESREKMRQSALRRWARVRAEKAIFDD
jgi:hypothetical protein